MKEHTRKKIKTWLKKVDSVEVAVRLLRGGAQLLTIDRIFRGSYPSEPRGHLRAVLSREMRKDGIHLDGEAS